MGYRRYGVPIGGAIDKPAAMTANVLCGNQPNAAVLEIVMHGAKLCVDHAHVVAFTGAGAKVFINDKEVPLYRALHVPIGAVIRFEYSLVGCRIYMAIAGGINTKELMGSKSYASVLHMPALTGGSKLSVGTASRLSENILASLGNGLAVASWGALAPKQSKTIRCLPGMEWDWLDDLSKRLFVDTYYMVSSKANRMGYMLNGAVLKAERTEQLISTAVMPGTVQLTPNGTPIVLMADAQTTGGYPRIAQVIEADLPILAQCRPDSIMQFKMVTIQEAIEASGALKQYISDLQQSINLQFAK